MRVFSRKTSIIPISIPLWEHYRDNNNCGYVKLCNITGGDTHSNFEGNDFVTIGRKWESDGDNSVRFYIQDDHGLNYLDCHM